jgi:hypothetical protein
LVLSSRGPGRFTADSRRVFGDAFPVFVNRHECAMRNQWLDAIPDNHVNEVDEDHLGTGVAAKFAPRGVCGTACAGETLGPISIPIAAVIGAQERSNLDLTSRAPIGRVVLVLADSSGRPSDQCFMCFHTIVSKKLVSLREGCAARRDEEPDGAHRGT